jgi:hypothetical protein
MTPGVERTTSRFDGAGNGITASFVERDKAFVVSDSDGLAIYDLKEGAANKLEGTQNLGIRGLTPSDWGGPLTAWGDTGIRKWSPGFRELYFVSSPLPLSCAVPLEDSRVAAGSLFTSDLLLLTDTSRQRRIPFHSAPIVHVAFRRETPLVSASLDGTLGLWEPRAIRPIVRLEGHTDAVLGCVLFDRSIVSFSADRTLRSWDWSSGRRWGPLAVMRGHTDEITAVVPYGPGRVASSSRDGTVRVWNVTTGQQTLEIAANHGWVTHMATSPDRRHIAAACDDRTIRLWDSEGKEGGIFAGTSPITTFGMSDEVVCAGDAAGNFWLLDYGAMLEKITLPARLGAFVVEDNLSLARDIAKELEQSGSQNLSLDPVNIDSVESLFTPSDLRSFFAEFQISVLFACNSMRDRRYDGFVDRLLRRSAGEGRLIVTFEDPRLWEGSPLARYPTLEWPNRESFREFAMKLRETVLQMAGEATPSP